MKTRAQEVEELANDIRGVLTAEELPLARVWIGKLLQQYERERDTLESQGAPLRSFEARKLHRAACNNVQSAQLLFKLLCA